MHSCWSIVVRSVALAVGFAGPLPAIDFHFAPPLVLPAGPAPSLLELRDVNADGLPDVVVLSAADGRVRVTFNQGGRRFGPPVGSPLGGVPKDWAFGDLNGDGLPDLAASFAGSPASIGLFANDGAGHFVFLGEIDLPGVPVAPRVALADVNEDGLGDVLELQNAVVRVFLGNGSGGLVEGAPAFVATTGLVELHAVHANSDGHTDLIVVQEGHGVDWVVLMGDGAGAFTPDAAPSEGPCAGSFHGSAVGDLNGDHRDDLVISYQDGCTPTLSTALQVGRSNGASITGEYPEDVSATPQNWPCLAIGDVTGDGYGDVMGSSTLSVSPTVGCLLAQANWFFAFGPIVPAGLPVLWVATGDLDLDGRVDVAATHLVNGTVSLLFNETSIVPGWDWAGGGIFGHDSLALLEGQGELVEGSLVRISVEHGPAGAATALIAGFQKANLSFKGGVLMPSPDLVIPGLVLSSSGGASLSGIWPAGLPVGFTTWFQAWFADPSGPKGFTASNGLTAMVGDP